MASTATVQGTITITGDLAAQALQFAGAANAASPVKEDFLNLSMGNTTLTAPTAATPTYLILVPPAGNTALMTLRGIAGDTGVALHKTNPTFIALDSTFVSCVINAGATVTGLRVLWV